MKITPQCIVVLCDDGTFRNIARPDVLPQPGDRIQVEEKNLNRVRSRDRRLVSARHWWIAASLLLLLGTVFWWKNSPLSPVQPSTLVAIDINPSIELLVNPEGRVHEARLLNDDAEWMLAEDSLAGMDIYEAVGLIIAKAEAQQFLDAAQGKDWIMLSKVDLESGTFSLDKEKISRAGSGYRMEWLEADSALIDGAKKANLSLNKYIVYEKAMEKGIRLNEDKLRSQSIAAALTEAGMPPESFFAEGGKTPADDKTSSGNKGRNPSASPSSSAGQPPKTGSEAPVPDSGYQMPVKDGKEEASKPIREDGKTKPDPADKGQGGAVPNKPALPPVMGTQPGGRPETPGKMPKPSKERDEEDDDDDGEDEDDDEDDGDEGEKNEEKKTPPNVRPEAPKPGPAPPQSPAAPPVQSAPQAPHSGGHGTPAPGPNDRDDDDSDDDKDDDDDDKDDDDDNEDDDDDKDEVTRNSQFFLRTPLKRS